MLLLIQGELARIANPMARGVGTGEGFQPVDSGCDS